VRNKRGLAVFFVSVMAILVSVAATWPRFHARTTEVVATEHPGAKLPLVASAPEAAGPRAWSRLTNDQREALAPFEGVWDTFDDERKRRWLRIAARYKKLSPDAQKRLQDRMTEWLHMTPEQRRTARENYQLSKQVPVEQRENAWNEYQQLPEDQKKTLAAVEKHNRRPTVVTAPPTGGKPELKNLNHALHAETLAEDASAAQIAAAAATAAAASESAAAAAAAAAASATANQPLLTPPPTPSYYNDHHP
jgi:hypothetical protein